MRLTVHSGGGARVLKLDAPRRLSEVLALHQLPLDLPCGGRKRCNQCRVRAYGALSAPDEAERTALGKAALTEGIRLACMTDVLGDAEVFLTEAASEHILTAGRLPEFSLDPLGQRLGVAVDIGTTTLAAYLYDLRQGVLLATAAAANPQAAFGADVISRLQKSHEGQRLEQAAVIRRGLNGLFSTLCAEAGVDRREIDAAVFTGNTAMLYLLTAQEPSSIIALPFEQDRFFGEPVPPADLELDLPGCRGVYLTRSISAYVGGDITTAALAAGLHCRRPEEGPCLLADIGTNGEMVLFHQGKCWCCSTAAGPTFEGAGIHMGMRAQAGAISHVSLENGRLTCQVLDGGRAAGICGSGIIDAVAVLLACGVVEDSGYLCEDGHDLEDHICKVGGHTAIRLPGTDVVLTQGDIRAVQLAKAAICAGMMTLLHRAGLDGQTVPLKIAGGFGSFIDVGSAEAIGMIPPGFAVQAQAIGNAAGTGASAILLSRGMLEASENFSRRTETVDLSADPWFMGQYPLCMTFPEGEG